MGWRGAGVVLPAVLLTSCGVMTATEPPNIPPITQVNPPVPSEPASANPHGNASGSDACLPDVKAAVDDVVGRQLAAFRAGDYDAAFALASEQFRAITDVQGLKALISKGHPEVSDAASHNFTECRQPNADLVLGAVTVTGENGNTVLLVYQFTFEDGSWHILQSAPMNGHGANTGGGGPSATGDV